MSPKKEKFTVSPRFQNRTLIDKKEIFIDGEETSRLALTPAIGFQNLPVEVQKYIEKERKLHRIREMKLVKSPTF